MRTVGDVLKQEREKKFYTLDEIEKATKIRKELLEALEQGQYQKLPPTTFIQGFIKNYGKFLGLNTEKLLAIFRREFSENKNPPRVLESFSNPMDKKRFRITPTNVLVSVVIALVIIFFVYLWFQYRSLVGSPLLEVDQPVDQFNATSNEIIISGKTDPEAKVSINDQEIGVEEDGKFSQQIKISENVSKIVIIASSKGGKQTKIERTVFLKSDK